MSAPDSEPVDATFQRAVRLHRAGDLGQAQALYESVVQRAPTHWDAIQLLGVLAAQGGRLDLAAERFAQAIDLQPSQAVLHGHLARAQVGLQRLEPALASCDRAIALQPEFAAAHETRSIVLYELERYADAAACAAKLAQLQPKNVAAHLLGAKALARLARWGEALGCYAAAARLAPNDPDVNLHYGLTLLKLGRLEEGFSRFQHRFASAGARPLKASEKPLWLGQEPIAGKRVLVPCEFYAGDVIHFARYARLAQAAGAKVILAAPQRLHRLLGSLGPDIELVAEDDDAVAFDCFCPSLSLPAAFGTTLETIPAETPYLAPEADAVRRWEGLIGAQGFKIGVCWQGSTRAYEYSMKRSFPLACLEPLAAVPGVRLISLQKFDGADQLDRPPAGMRVERLADPFDEGPDAFIDTAAAMANLDLIVTCDTAIAHLAGALGRPTWVALPYDADWRWLADRADSPWYPTMRLFRQHTADDWVGVFANMAEALQQLLGEPVAAPVRPAPLTPVSWGELVDKITILEIKAARITAEPAISNIRKEHAQLAALLDLDAADQARIEPSVEALRQVNEALWTVEDDLRRHEREGAFGEQFVELARSVYRLNDERAAIKRRINVLLGSDLVEEKSYAPK